jgi:hypothetical protein
VSDLAAAEATVPAGSTLSWRGLRDLLFAPRRFFSRGRQLTDGPEITIVAWVTGAALALDGADGARHVLDSWLGTWIYAIAAGAFVGALRWYIAGWFYAKRLEWSGAIDPDKVLARSVNAWQDFVMNAPMVLCVLAGTFVYSTPREMLDEAFIPAIVAIGFLFWSCITSYVGATTAFPEIKRGRAAIWFIAVPLVFYTILMVAVGAT